MGIVGIILGFIVLKWVLHVVVGVLLGLVPLALVGGGIYVAYQVYGRKALSGGRRTLP